ncbi:MAG: hypothetical protein A3C47_02180 [Omnitrophica bacterium RIFCSPHIGHO2_02_FULL_51_18]|nr:MAG: hypothetical protein A3C47_02180 [Omnitrophica bacterium RIFCSPHIGHO2_02_FULL_51_18]
MASCYALVERKIDETLSVYGLSPVTMNALLVIKHVGKNKGLPQSELCKKIIVTAGNITRLVDRLEKNKFVERVSLTGDRRVNLIKVTKKASDLLNKVWPIYKKSVDKIVCLPEGNLVNVTSVLESLRQTISQNNGGKIKP